MKHRWMSAFMKSHNFTTKGAALARVKAVSPGFRAEACAALRYASSFPLRVTALFLAPRMGESPRLDSCYPGPRRSVRSCSSQLQITIPERNKPL